ncbi:hypothetical protein RclHR1_04730003 [Rhizophagus clarus]|uniref:Uncharacterized protein n=1 Tax=Rhizophagus clarus TaxID=94130 RepID=A0A2Z6S1P2_9GLOM|nr:hypothetical protein RclHR1_04730003 [Rhizophagus clarus]
MFRNTVNRNYSAIAYLRHHPYPLVDQLLELWQGIELPKTFEHFSRKSVKRAIICCSCDIPAARKLCGFISARIACYRCYKHANYDDKNQPNYGGFDDMESWFIEKNINEIKNNASIWKACKT